MGDFFLLDLERRIEPIVLHFVNAPKPWELTGFGAAKRGSPKTTATGSQALPGRNSRRSRRRRHGGGAAHRSRACVKTSPSACRHSLPGRHSSMEPCSPDAGLRADGPGLSRPSRLRTNPRTSLQFSNWRPRRQGRCGSCENIFLKFLYIKSESRYYDASLDERRSTRPMESGRIRLAWAKRRDKLQRQGS